MNAATEFDIGPLTWVKGEIDLALKRADQALQEYTRSAQTGLGDLTQIKFCRTHLHQVQGALTIVGLDGVTQFTEVVEAMLDEIEQQKLSPDEASISLAQRALATIGHYLDDLVNGQPNQPLRLLSLYREVQITRGLKNTSATDLFFPDLSARPPRRETPARNIPTSAFQQVLRQERARFQRGLLMWLRAPHERKGVNEMLSAIKRIEDTQDAASARAFWWVATGFLTALAEGTVPEESNVKQLCARIDLQIRRLMEGSKNVAERLLRDALYFVANADSTNTAVRLVQNTYQLQTIIPSSETLAPAPEEAVLRRLRDVITSTEESWNKYCAGTLQSLPLFKENANALSTAVDQLGHTDFRRLTQAIAAAANWLSEDSARSSDMLAMEIATAILLAQNAQENFQRLGGDFAHQVDVTVARIHSCLAGTPPQPGSEIPLLDEMSRQAQEKLLIGQVAKEIQNNFAQIEQVLDGFFRDTEKRADLVSLEKPFSQVAGALTMMRHDSATTAVRECSEEIRRFSDSAYNVEEADFERIASQLSMIGFFIDSLQHGAADFDTFARQMQPGRTPTADETELVEEDSPKATLEQEVEQQKLETHALLSALKAQPNDSELREEVKLNLAALKKDADLVADDALGEQTKAMLSAMETGEDTSPQIEQVMATLKPQASEMLAPSTQTIQLSKASNEEIDAELLGIFLEEAKEVLATIDENVLALKEQRHNIELLTTIRRAFHTLKGSGRMVGLKDVGEAAWAIEQTLNLWLQQEREVGPSLLDLLGQAHALFSVWVQHLESNSGHAPDPTSLVALAELLRQAPEEAQAALLSTTPEPERLELEVPQVAEEPLQSAEIITLDFGAAQPESIDEDFTIDLEAVDMPNFDFNGPSTESPSPAADESLPLPANQSETEEAAPVEPVIGQRIAISPVLYEIFSEEARAHLATLQRELPTLERDELSPTPHDMYRAAHTLAGISATVGIQPVNQLGLALEHALLRRDNSAEPGSLEALGIIRQAVGEVELMLSDLAEQREPEVQPGLIDALDVLYPAQVVAPREHAADHEEMPEQPAIAEDIPEQEPAKAEVPVRTGFVTEIQQLRDEIDEQLLPIFLEEALDLNRGIAQQLRAWRAEPSNSEAVRTLTRLLHTLKGSARMAGAMNLGEIAHAIESHVDQANQAGTAAPGVIDEIDNSFDSVLHIIDRLQGGESLDLPSAALTEKQIAVPVTAEPAPAAEAVAVSIERRVDRARTHESDIQAEGDSTSQFASLRVRADLIDRLVNEAGELSIARARIEGEMRSLKSSLLDLTENVIRLRRQLREIEIQSELQMQSRATQPDEQHAGFDPLEFDRFTRFQELTRMMAESVNDVATVQQNLLKNLDDANAAIIAQARLNRDVQQQLMGVRMVPFGSVADRLYRIVRQTSKELNKRANLEIKGSQVELDRSVLDKMAAPLEHMLRNAIAHGLEERDVRVAHGKPDIGEISLTLKQEGNEIILSFSDDGAGLDFERIRTRAISVGLIDADVETDTTRLAELIFTPGFSTASELSQVAGRGIGMDVVKTEVSSLGGRIEIMSTPGQGTEFRLYIPLTLAVTKALLVRAGSKRYAIPSVMIEQVLDLKEAALTRIRDAGTAEWMGHHYPFSYLPHLLGDTQALPEQHRQYWTLLLRSGTRRISVQVDGLLGNQEIVVKNIGPQLARVIGVDGATVLGDGQVVLILNPVALSSRAPVAEFALPVPAAPTQQDEKANTARLPTVMVVDDSLTVRKVTGRLLAREGYQVVLAKDGVEALELLLDVIPDVMLVDIEMPRMDGFDLTRNIRADAHLKDIPIIMITSRTADKHRNYAFEIGVNQYLGKPYQEDELLQFVAEYVTRQRNV